MRQYRLDDLYKQQHPFHFFLAASIAIRIPLASLICVSEGENIELGANLFWVYCPLPTMPIVADRFAWAIYPGSSEISPNGPSTGRIPLALHAATIFTVG